MCGVFGVVSKYSVVQLLLHGLSQLEYRGYDSCGVAILSNGIQVKKSSKKVTHLSNIIKSDSTFTSTIGIAHTRWATHGAPTINNAHPICVDKVAVAHNGVIENYMEIKRQLEAQTLAFITKTDTEVIPHLIQLNLKLGLSPREAVTKAVKKLTGKFSIIVLFTDHNNLLIAAKNGLPLVLGYGMNTNFVSSDAHALIHHVQKITYLEDNDIAEIHSNNIKIYNNNIKVHRNTFASNFLIGEVSKGQYPYFMLKEIYEQPQIVHNTISQFINNNNSILAFNDIDYFSNIDSIIIIGCGSSYFAGLIAKYWIEGITNVRVYLDIASEFRYKNISLSEKDIVLLISQSGETADTLEALHYAKKHNCKIISLTNVPGNSMEQASDIALKTLAGVEIGVASTKTFSAQLSVLACFAVHLAQIKNNSSHDLSHFINYLALIPTHISHVLQVKNIDLVASTILKYNHTIVIGRGTAYGVALEGALKIRELSYINTIGIAAGEMKHGSIAVIDKSILTIAISPYNELFSKNFLNIQEIVAREGIVIAITDKKGSLKLQNLCTQVIELPQTNFFSSPIAYTVVMQLIAYTLAIKKGINADQPRNLAKSVTVE
ncbi:glutamine--fructose-6-phosphate transaminase (isomerizing) [Neoehrlichia mikurensis]|uniref:Glutamine--fructose-6-phosphate aminotransferase [isomerizing] n=1 Tax=Neoehrlichia mikurensis TaxID=89586 RepID=A0A9Q9F3U6_9RICK|nr:glutamine--fructose-6-phosphate transaminase (isomerizing) [Neoehrlichia mikurensis]QXK91665.1 glutamine--fructose-6-phosphate transaminase (isomerizing) [Neoehrlichia mikurensis]QXK92876.1 glutamine--fructose-6-phosphate transaminase (isomerizing) [Neoehrlichia mikurensis]QXK93356.1 glutamine--fructose-6-phosphate transaminase (isomerizing) [Neoehrlichia mikurensis]UTO55700.1 glutamine--fructose-6-phosphate transaminase (isomerizing) [Neoehrlichia mikurensis]UTO56617.1 glutamine--fructose-